jgi:hypothetical protein
MWSIDHIHHLLNESKNEKKFTFETRGSTSNHLCPSVCLIKKKLYHLVPSSSMRDHSASFSHHVTVNLRPLHLCQSRRGPLLLFPLALSPLSSQRRLVAAAKSLSIVKTSILFCQYYLLCFQGRRSNLHHCVFSIH